VVLSLTPTVAADDKGDNQDQDIHSPRRRRPDQTSSPRTTSPSVAIPEAELVGLSAAGSINHQEQRHIPSPTSFRSPAREFALSAVPSRSTTLALVQV
jgi:hypothetical protein